MKYVSAFVGSAILGALVFGIWPEMWMSYGIAGGWFAAAILVSIAWYMNHRLEIIPNPPDEAWVDMGWAVGAAGIGWAMVRFYPDCKLLQAAPTLGFVLLGAALGGLLAALIKQQNKNFSETTPE
jgi:hypothetical protein